MRQYLASLKVVSFQTCSSSLPSTHEIWCFKSQCNILVASTF